MTSKTVKHYVHKCGIYVYVRKYKEKNELIILNGTNDVQELPVHQYKEMLEGSRSGYELISGKKIDLTKNMKLNARQSLIIEY